MSKLSNIMLIVWGVLALVSFVSAFFCPTLFFKIIGLVFGGLNMLVILSLVITWLQGIYYGNKLKNEFEDGEES